MLQILNFWLYIYIINYIKLYSVTSVWKKNLITYFKVFTAFSNISAENERSSFTTAWINSSSIPNDKYICVTFIRRSFGLKLYLSKSFTYKVKTKTYIINLIFDQVTSFKEYAQNLPTTITLLNGWFEQFCEFPGKTLVTESCFSPFLCAHYQNHENCKRLNSYSASEIFF